MIKDNYLRQQIEEQIQKEENEVDTDCMDQTKINDIDIV